MPHELTPQQAIRYSRQILLQGFDLECQEKLLDSRALQIGVGGLGCASAQYLVAAGVGTLTLVDDDVVDSSNLQRQILHSEADIGELKITSAVNTLKALNSQCDISAIDQRLSDEQLATQLQQHDVVIDCSDNLATRNQLNRLCYQYKKPLVSGAAIRMEGQICSFIPSQDTPCYQCLSQLFGEQQLTCVEAGIMAPVVGIVGSMQALETIKILTGFGETLSSKLMLFDAKYNQWQTFTLKKQPNCPICQHT
ncbi:molybdopterin-synthase adenylyltransferase MoeB [Alteromonadaceae bacterium BrNp21-10]|nr:molybdopterin-synthase adenylyltransferase MoeB [Alteromonadaceae bacterium BrNp21-10]